MLSGLSGSMLLFVTVALRMGRAQPNYPRTGGIAMSKKSKKPATPAKRTSKPEDTAVAVADAPLPIKASDKRDVPGPNALTFTQARGNWDKCDNAEDLLDPKGTLTDYDSVTTLQYAIMSCRSMDAMASAFKALLGEALDLDKAAERAKAERSEDHDFRYLKEQLYVRASMAHLKAIAQPQTEWSDNQKARFTERMKTPYGKVKHIGKGGELKSGFAVKKRVAPVARAKTPTILGVRETAAGAKFCRALLEKGSMTKREMAGFLGSNTGNAIKRLGGIGSILVEAPKDATPDNTIIKPNPDWKD